MKRLKDILPNDGQYEISGNESVAIQELTLDSREVKPGWLFIAKKGVQMDGHDFIDQAITNGASAILLEKMPEKEARMYGDKAFTQMMYAKVVTVQLINRMGYDVLFQDVDLVWYKNPLWS